LSHIPTPEKIGEQATQFLSEWGVKGTILFCMVTGSHAYNLAHEDSDLDYLGLYAFDTIEFLALNNNLPRESLSTQPETHPEKDDITLHEAGHFAMLLAKGNPFIVESLFATKHVHTTPYWEKLRGLRQTVLNQRTVDQYLSYCKNQIIRHEKKPLPGKRVYHIIRMLYEALHIIEGRTPVVCFPPGPELELMKKVRADAFKEDELTKLINELYSSVASKPKDHLPKGPDEKLISDWLVNLRLNLLEEPKHLAAKAYFETAPTSTSSSFSTSTSNFC